MEHYNLHLCFCTKCMNIYIKTPLFLVGASSGRCHLTPVSLSATDTPPTCTKTNYIPELVEGDCVATLPEDLGFCYGKCGQNPAWCCRPEGTENVSLNITFECEDGSSRTESVSTSYS